MKAVSQDGNTFARELWKVVIGGDEDQYQKRVTVGPAGTSLVYDFDIDGRYVILASIKNGQPSIVPSIRSLPSARYSPAGKHIGTLPAQHPADAPVSQVP